ncbi:MAG: YwmB family TATA-box binding protein [Clostridia bacterium]|nr:YwmB family TATA-box binding protein [Clostridia bacterium]
MLKRFGFFIAFFLIAAYAWFINSVSVFGEKYPATEVYSSFSSSVPITVSDKFSFARVPIRCGEGFVADQDFDAAEFLEKMKARIVSTENGGEVFSIYAYTPEIDNFIKIDGVKINLHIAENKVSGVIKVASPVVFGSF